MRALFFGTPTIAVAALDALAEVAEVVGVVCQPDRPSGRGLSLTPPPVKERALARGFEVMQPTKIRTPEFEAWMLAQKADVALVIAYGRILPKAVLDAPRRGCMNLHASLLPRYRGAAPIQWAIVRGEIETGISLMQMDEGCDTGPVLSRHVIPIAEDATGEDLARQLGLLAADVVRSDLARAVDGELTPVEQEHALATEAPMLTKEDGRVTWERPARQVHDHARGMTPWPGAFTTASGQTFKLLATRVDAAEGALAAPGTVIRADKSGVTIACGAGSIALLRGQQQGRKALDARDLVAGRALREGLVLGS